MNEMPRDRRPAKSIRVLLAEERGMTHGALALLLNMEPDIEVVAWVSDGDAAVADTVLTHRVDVVLLDLGFREPNALGVAAELRAQAPDCRVLVLATHADAGTLRRALAAGVAGFLVKDGPVGELAEAVRCALSGETVIDPSLGA